MRTTNKELREMVHFRDGRIQSLEGQVSALLESDRAKDVQIQAQRGALKGRDEVIDDLQAEVAYVRLWNEHYYRATEAFIHFRIAHWCFPVRRFLRWILRPLP